MKWDPHLSRRPQERLPIRPSLPGAGSGVPMLPGHVENGAGGHGVGMTLFPLRVTAGTRARYVDVLNPGGPQRSEPTLAPTDLFAPLAPLPIPAHLLGPNAGTQPG